MRYQYDIPMPTFSAENIHFVDIIRDNGFVNHYKSGRTYHGFLYVVRGAIRFDFAENVAESILLQPNELLFIPQKTVYTSTYLADETEVKMVQFDLTSGTLPSYMLRPLKPDLPNAGKLIGAFWRPPDSYAFGHPFYALSCFYELMWQLDLSQSAIPSKYKRLQPALWEMSANFTDNLPIGHYAALCGISEPTFRRLFREYMGMSPLEHRNDMRLHHARLKLQSGEFNVSEAAELSGFSNLSFFIRVYKKKYGHTPKKA